MLTLYMGSAIGGNLFSGILKPEAIGVGASTAVFGLVGFYLAYVITNYNYMDRKRFGQHWCLLLFVFLLVLLNIGVGLMSNDNHVDNFGHLGGFITGFFAGLAITELFDYEARYQKRVPDRFTEEEYIACGNFCKGTPINWFGCFFFVTWMFTVFIYYNVAVDTSFERDPFAADD